MKRWSTVSVFLSLPVLIQFENIEEDLAGQAALAAAPIWWEKRRRRLQRGQTPAGGPHRVQRSPRIPTAPRVAALHRRMAADERTETHVNSWQSPAVNVSVDRRLPELPPQQVVDDVRVCLDQAHQDFLLELGRNLEGNAGEGWSQRSQRPDCSNSWRSVRSTVNSLL